MMNDTHLNLRSVPVACVLDPQYKCYSYQCDEEGCEVAKLLDECDGECPCENPCDEGAMLPPREVKWPKWAKTMV